MCRPPTVTAALALTALLLLSRPPVASAWSSKEHIQLTRMAAERLVASPDTPPAMKAWLKEAVPGMLDSKGEEDYFLHSRVGQIPRGVDGIAYWSVLPDLVTLTERDKPLERYGVPEGKMHFLDVEQFMPDGSKRTYADDLSHKPKLADFPRDVKDPRYQQAGMLPFRVEECYRNLVKCFREDRLVDTPGRFPRDEHAAKWAGYLAHYVQDNTQPHHATVDYQSWTYFPTGARPNVHGEMEYKMCDDDRNDYPTLRKEFWPMFLRALNEFEDPVKTADPWQSTVEIALKSYDALPLIGAAAVHAAKKPGGPDSADHRPSFDTEAFFRFKGQCDGREMTVMEMKARQLAWAVERTQRLWRDAWDEGHGVTGRATTDSRRGNRR